VARVKEKGERKEEEQEVKRTRVGGEEQVRASAKGVNASIGVIATAIRRELREDQLS
jgi:hypothetical protein